MNTTTAISAEKRNNCKVVSVANQKGGVAKTTTAVNLGIGLAREGRRVLLIDADAQGSLTASLGVREPDLLEYTLSTVMGYVINDESFDIEKGIFHHEEGADLMPGNIELSGMEISLVNIMSREYVLREYIELMAQMLVAVLVISSGIVAWYDGIWQIGMFLPIILTNFYNGESGKKNIVNKWSFYLFYPIHFLVFWLVLKA